MPTKHLAGAMLSLLLLCASALHAQPHSPRRVPVTIVIADHLARPDAPFLIQRRPNRAAQDAIVLRSDATSGQLSDAIRALMAIRQAGADSARVAGTMRIRPNAAGSVVTPRGRSPRRSHEDRISGNPLPWAERVLRDLRRADKREVAGIGVVQAVEIWLPPSRA